MTIDFLKIGSGVASAALIVSGFAYTAGAQDAEIADNGADSDNAIVVTETNTVDLVQTNTNDSSVTLTVTNNSGNNTSNDNTNTGGGITTGDSTTALDVTIGGMTNEAALDICGCEADDDDDTDAGLGIRRNGARSINTVDVNRTNDVIADQVNDNNAAVAGAVTNNSGGNVSNGNTGGDDEAELDDDEDTNRRSRIRTGSNNTTATVTIRGSRNRLFRLDGLTFTNGSSPTIE